jgi:chromosome segregation ATPase
MRIVEMVNKSRIFKIIGIVALVTGCGYTIFQNYEIKKSLESNNTAVNIQGANLNDVIVARYTDMDQKLYENQQNILKTQEVINQEFQKVSGRIQIQENQSKAIAQAVGNQQMTQEQIIQQLRGNASSINSLNEQYQSIFAQIQNEVGRVGNNQQAIGGNVNGLYGQLDNLSKQIALVNARNNGLLQAISQNDARLRTVENIITAPVSQSQH